MDQSKQKQKFDPPKLIKYGTVNEMTHAFGNHHNHDFIFMGGPKVEHGFHSLGSRDGIIVPQGGGR